MNRTCIQVLSLSVAFLLFLLLEYGIADRYVIVGGIWSLYHFRHFAGSIYRVIEKGVCNGKI